MDKDTILYWAKKYDEIDTEESASIERELTKKIRANGFLTKDDLIQINKWKFQRTMPGRFKRQLNLVEKVLEKDLISISSRALHSAGDEERLKILNSLKCGVGNAVGSVVLTFYDPKNYGVFDIHAWRELFEMDDKNMSDPKFAIIFFKKLREISLKTGLDCKTIEKALFTKNYVESKQ